MAMDNRDTILLENAFNLLKNGFNKEAVLILKDLIEKYPSNTKVVTLLGLTLANMEARNAALPYLEKAVKLSPSNELLHLSLYISYVHIEEYDNAFNTIFSFLEKYPADLFRDTLKELLIGLKSDYGSIYRDEIIFYARKNHVQLPKGLI